MHLKPDLWSPFNSEYIPEVLTSKWGEKGLKRFWSFYAISARGELESKNPFWHCTQKWGRQEESLQRHPTKTQQCQGDHLSCHSNLCHIWCLSACACACAVGVNKSQQISLWATSEIIIMVIAPQKEALPSGQLSRMNIFFFPADIALLLSPGWAQSSSSPWRRCFLPLCWCFNNLHSNVISKLASIVSSGRLCAMKLHSILRESPVVWEPMPAKVTCWEKNKWMEITVALQPWMPYQLGNNREKVGRKKKKNGATVCLAGSWGGNYMRALFLVVNSEFYLRSCGAFVLNCHKRAGAKHLWG